MFKIYFFDIEMCSVIDYTDWCQMLPEINNSNVKNAIIYLHAFLNFRAANENMKKFQTKPARLICLLWI